MRSKADAEEKVQTTYNMAAAQLLCMFFVSSFFNQIQCAHILGLGHMGVISHNRLLWKIGKELQTRGHNYTQILPNFSTEFYDDVNIKIFNSSLTVADVEEWKFF